MEKPAKVVVNKSETQKEETVQDWVVNYLIQESEIHGLQPWMKQYQQLARSAHFCPKGKCKVLRLQASGSSKTNQRTTGSARGNLKIKGLGIGERAGIVHRLDKETSGILLVAKTQEAFDKLQDQFEKRQVSKKYVALVHGKIEADNGVIKEKIARNPFNRTRFGVFPEGREAETEYQVIAYAKDYTLVEVTPKTGRTHQIRVHFKHINHPVVGDELYAGRKTSRNDRKWCKRQFLHASYLKISHPKTGLPEVFRSKLPQDLQEVWDNLRKE